MHCRNRKTGACRAIVVVAAALVSLATSAWATVINLGADVFSDGTHVVVPFYDTGDTGRAVTGRITSLPGGGELITGQILTVTLDTASVFGPAATWILNIKKVSLFVDAANINLATSPTEGPADTPRLTIDTGSGTPVLLDQPLANNSPNGGCTAAGYSATSNLRTCIPLIAGGITNAATGDVDNSFFSLVGNTPVSPLLTALLTSSNFRLRFSHSSLPLLSTPSYRVDGINIQAVVPEPSSMALLLSGAALLGFGRGRRRGKGN